MKETQLTKIVAELIKEDLAVMDEIVEEDIEALGDIGNPEKLIGKKYEEWTPQDLQMLGQIYGSQEPNRLSKFIFNKEYSKVQELEEGI